MTKPKCFIIGPIGKPGSPERERSDNVQKYLIKPSIGRAFEIVRADQLSEAGSITAQVISLLHDANLVVADLSGLNPNVIYELGIRHSFNGPVVQLIDSLELLPFDLQGERTIYFNISNPSSIDNAGSELKSYVSHLFDKKNSYISPVARVGYVANISHGDAYALIGR